MQKLAMILLSTGVLVGALLAIIFLVQKNNPGAIIKSNPSNPQTRTINEISNSITINFGQCLPDKRRIDVRFGSTYISIIGLKTPGICTLQYSNEIENPNGGYSGSITCSIPTSFGIMKFAKSDYGLALNSIEQYCIR
jgi:hypothetical protein